MKIPVILLLFGLTAAAAVKIEKINFGGWPNCYRVTNGEVEAIVTSDVGPRVMRYGFVGDQNLFKEFKDQLGKSGEPDWQMRGGHRVWIGPEDRIKSYAPDNGPVHVSIEGETLVATEPVEPLTGIEKQITLKMAPTGTAVEVIHRLRNAGKDPYILAPWALTMMAQGGVAIHGFPPRGTHPENLAPTNPLVMWPFSNLSDPRWTLLRKYLILRQDPKNSVPTKLGSFNRHTWAAYVLNGEAFVKEYRANGDPPWYPDYGCSFETFTNADFLEMETLGPVEKVNPGESVTHVEHWTLHKNVHVAHWTDDELDRVIAPLVSGR